MSNGDFVVKFGGDSADLDVAAANAKASIASLTRELNNLAAQQQKVGASAESDLGRKMAEVAQHLAAARQGFEQSRNAMASHAAAARDAGGELSALKERLDGLEQTFVRLAALAGVAFTFDSFKEWVKSTTEAAAKIREDADSLGVSAEQVQQLKGFFELTGTGYDGLRDSLAKLQNTFADSDGKIDNATAALKAFGIQANQIKEGTLAEKLEVLGEAFAKFSDGPTKAAAAEALGLKELIPFLDRGRQGVEELNDAITRSSYVMGGDAVAAIAATKDHIAELSLAWSGLSRIYAVINPAIDAAIQAMTRLINSVKVDEVGPAIAALSGHLVDFGASIATFAVDASANWQSFEKTIVDSVGGITSAISDIRSALDKVSNWGQFPPGYLLAQQTGKAQFWSKLGVISPETAKEMIDSATKEYNDAINGRPSTQTFGGLDVAGEKLQFALQGIEDHAKKAKDALAGWFTPPHDPRGEQNLFGPAAPDGAFGPFKPQVPAMDTGSDGKAGASHAAQDAEEELRGAITSAQTAFAAIKSTLDQALSEHKVTIGEWAKDTTAALDHEADAVQDAYARILANAAIASAKKVEIVANEAKELQDIWDKEGDAQRKLVDDVEKTYEGYANTVASAFDSQIKGLLAGTEKFHTAFKNVMADLTTKFIESSIEMTAKWLADEAARTVAAQVGAAAQASAASAGGLAGVLANSGAIMKAILSDAAAAFGGVFAFLAPVMGPAAAGPAAGAYGEVAGMAGAVASADIGMWSVPHDQLALVHHNELIMPAGPAGALRAMLSGGGGEGDGGAGARVSVSPQANFHIHSMDSATVAATLRNNGGAVMKAIEAAVRDGAHLGMRRLRR